MILEDMGYKLANCQYELTYPQELFLNYGYKWLYSEKQKEINKNK